MRIFQADTGLVAGAAETFPWLAGIHGDPDPRQRFACLTVAGARALATMIEVHVAGIDERFFAELSATQTGQLAAIWRRLLRADARARHQLEDAAGDR